MILAILQARCSSTRLPGKVLLPILGKPMLAMQIERLQRVQQLDQLLVATSTDTSDDAIETLCRELGVACYRGSLYDVLDRFYQAAKTYHPDYVVRLTGDCPLADPTVIDEVISTCVQEDADYASNTLTPTFPDGLDAEVMTFPALEVAWREATLPSQREHVTPFIHQQPGRFKLVGLTQERDLSSLRWTVDEPEDFEFVRRVYEQLYPSNPAFRTADILALLDENPAMGYLNAGIICNKGYLKSLREDEEFTRNKGMTK